MKEITHTIECIHTMGMKSDSYCKGIAIIVVEISIVIGEMALFMRVVVVLVPSTFQLVPQVVSVVRFYCTSTGPIGGLNCEVLLYFNWSHRWSQL